MKTESFFVRSGITQKIASTKGKYSTQFMSGGSKFENSSSKKSMEDGIRMGGYEVNIRKPVTTRSDFHQPMARYSEFWIG